MWNRLARSLANASLIVLGDIIGGKAGPIVTTVGGAVLGELGVTAPEQAAREIESDPEAVASRGLKPSVGPNGRPSLSPSNEPQSSWPTRNRSIAASPTGGGRAACT